MRTRTLQRRTYSEDEPDSAEIVAVLNMLLTLEGGSLARRAVESNVFVSPHSVRAWHVVQKMAKASRENAEELTNLILDLCGQPRPRAYDTATAALHFQELSSVLADLVRAHEKVIAAYRSALPRLAEVPKAASLAAPILAQHESHLRELPTATAKAVPHQTG